MPSSSVPSSFPFIDSEKIRDIVSQSKIFSCLPKAAVADLAGRMTMQRLRAGMTVVHQGETGDTAYLIASGRIKVSALGDSGREVTLSLLRKGEGFGEMSLLDGRARSASCTALEPTVCLVLSRPQLAGHLSLFPATAISMLGEMARRLRRADESITQLALCDVNERLVHKLVRIAQDEGVDIAEGRLVRKRPTQQDLASMIGSCRETISRAYGQLVRDGLLLSRGRSVVVTKKLLASFPQPVAA